MLRYLLKGRSIKDRSKYQELPSVDVDNDEHSASRADADASAMHARKQWDYGTQKPHSRWQQFISSFTTWFLLKCIAGVAVLIISVQVAAHAKRRKNTSATVPPQRIHHGTLPTLLNVVNVRKDSTRQYATDDFEPLYVYSLDNPQYDRIQKAMFMHQVDWLLHETANNVTEWPELSVDSTTISFYEPLVLSWTAGAVKHSASTRNVWSQLKTNKHDIRQPLVTDETLIILACYDEHDEPNLEGMNDIASRIVEVATVEQALQTSAHHITQTCSAKTLAQYNISQNDEASSWFIPRFPAIRRNYCQFALYQPMQVTANDKMETLVELARSPRLSIQSLHRPMAIHLALSSNSLQMVVDFTTGKGGESACIGVPVVEYGLVEPATSMQPPFSQRLRRLGTTSTYAASDMCQAPANQREPGKFIAPGCLHSVTMEGLLPDTRYWYQVGVKDGENVLEWSNVKEFTSAPVTGVDMDEDNDLDFQPFTFLAYGDQGCPSTGWTKGGEWIARMVEAELDHDVTSKTVRMVHHIGDLSYAEGAAHIWDEWQHMIEPITSRVPYMVGVGNHEYDHTGGGIGKDPSGVNTPDGFRPDWGNFGTDSGGECGVATAKRFTMPQSDTSNGVFWYSYEFANLHTIMISSEHDLAKGSPQHTWLENDLRLVDRTRTPWIIVETHRPLYNPETLWEQNNVGIAMRYEIEDLLYTYKVDLVLAGHYHSYFRSCNGLYRDECNKGGPTYLTIGSAGARLDEAWFYPNAWTAKSIQKQYGYGRITIMNATAVHFEFVKVGDYNDATSGQIGDDFWLHRNR
ncbi:hypothetical protein MPSEU_000835500 [Mayamaea pseudoterrestris]|nr:hypothetical protein MPSEU_000835500 [Mayamaea pseudoterrestris]